VNAETDSSLAYKLKVVYLTRGTKNYAYSKFRQQPAVSPWNLIVTDINDTTM